MTCNLCYGRGFLYQYYQEEYNIEVCDCMRSKEIKNEIN